MKSPESIRKSNKPAFCLLMVPLFLYLLAVLNQFQSDWCQRKARSAPEDLPEAAHWLQNAVNVDPEDAETQRNLGTVYQLMAQKEKEPERRLPYLGKAAVSYSEAVNSVPTDSANHINLGWVRFQMDEIRGLPPREGVTHSFQLAALLDPFNYYPHYLLGDYLLHQGRREEAFAELHRAIQVYPHDEVIRTIIKTAMKSTRDYGELSAVIPLDIPLAHLYFARALFEDLNNWDGCKQEFQEIFRIEPQNPYYRDWYLRYCIQRGDIAAAVAEIEERAKLLGDDPKTLLRLAEFLRNKGELDKAKEYCLRARETAPDLPEASGLLAEIERDQGNIIEATIAYEDQIHLHPQDPEGYYGLALLYLTHGNPYRATELLLKAAFLAPNQAKYLHALADAYSLLGVEDKALEALSRCKGIDPRDLSAYLQSGEIQLKKEDWMEAAHEFYEALKIQPNQQQALLGFLKAQSRIP
jgi:tetratricopeptide (TPR) repeat protein